MKKFLAVATAVVLVLSTALLSGCFSKKESLVIYTWEDYVPPEVVKQFEEETGIKVTYASFSDNEEMYASFSQKKDQYDIIVCSDYVIDRMINQGGYLEELDRSKISNYSNIDPAYQSKYYDPDNRYTVPHASGSAIIVYDSAEVDFPITGYRSLWDEPLRGRVVLLDGSRDIIGMTLQMLGYSLNETDPEALELARQELLKLKPNVIRFDADRPHEAIISGDATVGYMFGSQATAAMEAVDTVKFVYPEEGISAYIDCYVISAKAPNKGNAYKFLNYVLDGEISAQISSTINYVNCNLAAREFLPQEYLDNPMVNIPDELMKTAEFFMPIGDAEVLYDKIWTEFKAAR